MFTGHFAVLFISSPWLKLLHFTEKEMETLGRSNISQVSSLVVCLPREADHLSMLFTLMSPAMLEENRPIWPNCIWHRMQRGLLVSTQFLILGPVLHPSSPETQSILQVPHGARAGCPTTVQGQASPRLAEENRSKSFASEKSGHLHRSILGIQLPSSNICIADYFSGHVVTVEIKEEIASLVNGHRHGLLPLIICNTNKGPFVPSESNY